MEESPFRKILIAINVTFLFLASIFLVDYFYKMSGYNCLRKNVLDMDPIQYAANFKIFKDPTIFYRKSKRNADNTASGWTINRKIERRLTDNEAYDYYKNIAAQANEKCGFFLKAVHKTGFKIVHVNSRMGLTGEKYLPGEMFNIGFVAIRILKVFIGFVFIGGFLILIGKIRKRKSS